MEIKGKITKSEFKNEWKNPKTGSLVYYHTIEVDGKVGQIGSTKKNPDFLAVGQEIELDATETDRGMKFKRDVKNNFSGGKASSKKQTYEETQRMCKMSALKAASEVNSKHGRVVIDEKGGNAIARFVLGDIRGDLENKWDAPESKDMMCRQSALHSAATETEAQNIGDANKLVEVAKEKYKYIIG